jgi:hypothetical protein
MRRLISASDSMVVGFAGSGSAAAAFPASPTPTTSPHHPRGSRRRQLAAAMRACAPLPVAGIDPAEAGGALYSVRRAFAGKGPGARGGEALPDLWLATLSCAQEASDRLLRDLDSAHASAAFWRARMRAGGHGRFMLLGRGPAQFASGLMLGLGGRGRGAAAERRNRIGGGGGAGAGAESAEAATSGAPAIGAAATPPTTTTSPSATDRIQERIDALDALSRSLAMAVSRVHRAADLLRLELPAGTAGAAASAAARAAAPSAAAIAPSAPLAAADPDAAERAVAQCLSQLRAALEAARAAAAEAARRGEGDEGDHGGGANKAAAAGAGAGSRAATPAPSGSPARNRNNATAQQDLAAVVALLEADPDDDGVDQLLSHAVELTTTTTITTTSLVLGGPESSSSPVLLLDAADALSRAARRALARGPFAPPPTWARMPSRLQRHWLRYATLSLCACACAGWAYRHSRLAGSDDLERWSRDGAAALSAAWRAHVVEPLAAVRRELFATLRDRPSIVSPSEFAEDREALLRMLRAFEQDHGDQVVVGVAEGADGAAADAVAPSPPAAADAGDDGLPLNPDESALLMSRGMSRVMTTYERELRSPLRNLLAGSLARAVLIQVQRLKLDTEAAMLELDQILRANELSLTLVAAVPSLMVAGLVARWAWRLLLVPSPPDPKREAVACRMEMGRLERALSAARAARRAAEEEEEEEEQQQQQGARGAGKGGDAVAGAAAVEANASAVAVAEGLCVHALARAFGEASRLYRGGSGGAGGGGGSGGAWSSSPGRRSEWPQLREGMVQMARPPLSNSGKLEYHSYLMRTFALFQA